MANVNQLVEEALEDLDKDKKLSNIVNKCLRIAHAIDDPKAIYSLGLETTGQDKARNQKLREDFSSSMMRKYNDHELTKEIHKQLAESYLDRHSLRVMDKQQNIKEEKMIKSVPISELEAEIERIKLSLERNEIPEGLSSLDLYFEKQSKDKTDIVLIFYLGELQSIESRIKDYLYAFLIDLEGQGVQGGNSKLRTEKEMSKKVFIIHGHNEAKRRELESLLKDDFDLEPIVLEEQLDRGSSTIIDKFEFYAQQCSYAIALFTPDDVVEKDGQKYFQARPNVLYELGWFSSRLSRERVLMLLKEGKDMEIFSDFDGVIQKRFNKNVSEQYKKIKEELEYVGMI